MNSRDYWAQREDEALKHRIADEAEYNRELHRIYQDMLDGAQREIDAFYGKYATAEGITIAEAKKRVKKADIAEYERKAKKYVRDASQDRKLNGGKTDTSGYYFSSKANEEMRLYNTMMKINRLEMLKANIGLELVKGHAELETFMAGILQGRTEDELKRQAGILGKTVLNNGKAAHAIVNGSFHNGTFSDRIWQYQDIMREDLGRLLQTGLIQGKNPRAIAKDLKKYWYGNDPRTGGGAQYCMERLMRTELARVQTEAQKLSFERNGFDQYIFITNSGCCGDCTGKDGKHFPVEKMMPGLNAPPMHPNCRCSVAAYSDDKEYEEWLDYLDKGGTTEEYNKLKAAGKPIPKPTPKTETAKKTDFDSVKLTGIDDDYLPDIQNTLDGLMSDYPIKGLTVKTNKASTEFGHYNGQVKGVTRNGKQYAVWNNEICYSRLSHKNKATSAEEHRYNYNARMSALANAKRCDLATIPHEYAHAVDVAYTLARDPKLKAFADRYQTPQPITVADVMDINDFNLALHRSDHRLSKEIFDELQTEYGLDYGGTIMRIADEYGTYAASSIAEFLAEATANMRVLPDADKTDFMRSFERVFNRKFNEVLGG